jgi:hypothetical protein
MHYPSSSYQTHCNTSDNVCLDLKNCHYSIYIYLIFQKKKKWIVKFYCQLSTKTQFDHHGNWTKKNHIKSVISITSFIFHRLFSWKFFLKKMNIFILNSTNFAQKTCDFTIYMQIMKHEVKLMMIYEKKKSLKIPKG